MIERKKDVWKTQREYDICIAFRLFAKHINWVLQNENASLDETCCSIDCLYSEAVSKCKTLTEDELQDIFEYGI